jgi:hypothetical protein
MNIEKKRIRLGLFFRVWLKLWKKTLTISIIPLKGIVSEQTASKQSLNGLMERHHRPLLE